MFFVTRQDRHAEMRLKRYSAVSCPSRSPSINNNSSINSGSSSSSSAKRQGFPDGTAATCSCWCCFSSGGNYECNCDAASPSTADPKLVSLLCRVPRLRRHKNASSFKISIRHLSLEARLVTLVVVGIFLLLPPLAVKVIVPVEGVRVSGSSSGARVTNGGERVQALLQCRPHDSDTWKGSSIPKNRRRGRGEGGENGEEKPAGMETRGVAEAAADSYRLRGGAEGRRRGYCLWGSREREQAEDGGRRWSKRSRSDSMRRAIELAKADAKAVRAAAQEAASSATVEAAWAASGAVQGGCIDDNASMLFLECEVNGRRLRASVDTGAQVTAISRACAEYCGLASQIDKRFMGNAIGVGFARILGRIHHAVIRIGNADLTCSLTVIEDGGEIDLLVGLDVLRAHRCDISLSRNRMRFMAAGGWREMVDSSVQHN